jgi:hypothetical protein
MGSATAVTGSTILLIDKDEMILLLHKQHALSDRFISHMLSRNISGVKLSVLSKTGRETVIAMLALKVFTIELSVLASSVTRKNPAAGEYRKVPNPDNVDATFWLHQFKLLEGIDDARFQLIALYSELRSMRAFVQ